jgi:hypothetical protein
MNMMTPVTGNVPATAVPGALPVSPVEPARPFAQDDPGQERPGDDRDRGSETTLRYKFDWLVQRQVRAGTIDEDEAAEMIRLFDRTIAGPDTGGDSTPGNPPAPDDGSLPAPGREAAAALLDRMRDRFGVEGPYDDSGGQAASAPLGMVVDEQL